MSIISKLFFLIAIICNLSANGQAVSEQVMNEVVNNFTAENFPGGARKIRSVIPYRYDNLNTLNLYELEPEGWILLSTDIRAEPVIGFSFSGQFKKPDENANDPMYNWFNLYQRQIKQIITNDLLKEQSGWRATQKSEISNAAVASTIKVKPFMAVNWGQGAYWNQFCPSDMNGPGDHVYVGCVAVSMAQAMSVFKTPVKGQGSNNYQDPKYGTQFVNFGDTYYHWDSMSVSRADQYNSLLLYHCAVAVNMNFGTDGSGTQTINAASALWNYFSFSHNLQYRHRTGTDQAWQDILNAELLKGRPIIYAGDADDGNPGHAFNIDGVINSSYFHINWGWSGDNNGYYTLDALNAGSTNFNKNQAAIIGIHPFYYPTDIVLSDTIIKEYQPIGTTVGIVNVIDEATDNSYVLKLYCDSVNTGTEWVNKYYLDGDSLKTGRIFTYTDNRIDSVSISVKDQFNNLLLKKILLKVGDSPTGVYLPEEDPNDYFTLYPNPATDYIFFNKKAKIEIISVRIFSISGTLVQKIIDPDIQNGIQISTLKEGIYILEAELKNHSLIRKRFIRN
jgi:hypothetical protein